MSNMLAPVSPVDAIVDRWMSRAAIVLRWGALAIALLLAVLQRSQPVPVATGGALLAAAAAWHTWPRMRSPGFELRAALVVELAVALLALALTGAWSSPFIVYLGAPILFLGFELGPRGGLVAAVAASVALLGLQLSLGVGTAPAAAVQPTLVIALALGIGVFGGTVARRAEQEHDETLGRITQLGHVNAMLSTLYDLVRTMPAPLSVDEIVRVIRQQLHEVFDADAVALLTRDGEAWRPMFVEGFEPPSDVSGLDLPPVLVGRDPSQRPRLEPSLADGQGLWPEARSGAYLWLWSRGRPTGLLVLEYREPGQVPPSHGEALERLGVPLALALDNAVWFRRLRTLGAEEERQRIGARLHDRFAQSLAFVAMELDRTSARHPDDEQLSALRDGVRSTLVDLRETLRELRLSVDESKRLTEVLPTYVERFGDRFGLVARFEASGEDLRAPVPVEQQLLRIVQDLLSLAQREMGATAVNVSYETGLGWVRLVVEDDGRGLDRPSREAASIVALVRERVGAIGGELALERARHGGARVTVEVRGLL